MSVFVGGVTPEYEIQIKEVVTSRLQADDKITSVLKCWWRPHREKHLLRDFIEPGALTRGGEMASFVLFMANSGRIKWSTMQGYVWCICTYHFNRYGASGDPLTGVADWACFMAALQVQTWVDSIVEPRKMIPFMVMVRTLKALDFSSRKEVGLGCMILMMYYTMSRSETPLPKSSTSFDRAQHVRRRDVRLLMGQYVEWGFGKIKQKKRVDKDPNDRDWKPVGACTGILNMRLWFDKYVSMSEWSSDEDPFFYDESGPLVYHSMLKFFRVCMSRVISMEEALTYGFHSLRVLGYNCWRAASGEEVAVLQGGWGSDGHRAYSREMLMRILGMAQKGAQYAAEQALPLMPLDAGLTQPTLPVPLAADNSHVFTDEGAGSSAEPVPAPVVAAPQASRKRSSSIVSATPLPNGVTMIPHSKDGRSWKTYTLNGRSYSSLKLVLAAYASLPASFESFLSSNYKFV